MTTDRTRQATAEWHRCVKAGNRVGAYLAILAIPRKRRVLMSERMSALGALYPHSTAAARTVALSHLLEHARRHGDNTTGRVAVTALARNLELLDLPDRRRVIDLACDSRFGWQNYRALADHLTDADRDAILAKASAFSAEETAHYLDLDPPPLIIAAELDERRRRDCCLALSDQSETVLVTFLEIYGVPDETLRALTSRLLSLVQKGSGRRLLRALDPTLADAAARREPWVGDLFFRGLVGHGPLRFAATAPRCMAALFTHDELATVVDGIVAEQISILDRR